MIIDWFATIVRVLSEPHARICAAHVRPSLARANMFAVEPLRLNLALRRLAVLPAELMTPRLADLPPEFNGTSTSTTLADF